MSGDPPSSLRVDLQVNVTEPGPDGDGLRRVGGRNAVAVGLERDQRVIGDDTLGLMNARRGNANSGSAAASSKSTAARTTASDDRYPCFIAKATRRGKTSSGISNSVPRRCSWFLFSHAYPIERSSSPHWARPS